MNFLGSLIGMIYALSQNKNKSSPVQMPAMPNMNDDDIVAAGDAQRKKRKTTVDLTGGLMSAPTLGRGSLYGV
jgi:hypothetical protein